jgi:hypothetical protein
VDMDGSERGGRDSTEECRAGCAGSWRGDLLGLLWGMSGYTIWVDGEERDMREGLLVAVLYSHAMVAMGWYQVGVRWRCNRARVPR